MHYPVQQGPSPPLAGSVAPVRPATFSSMPTTGSTPCRRAGIWPHGCTPRSDLCFQGRTVAAALEPQPAPDLCGRKRSTAFGRGGPSTYWAVPHEGRSSGPAEHTTTALPAGGPSPYTGCRPPRWSWTPTWTCASAASRPGLARCRAGGGAGPCPSRWCATSTPRTRASLARLPRRAGTHDEHPAPPRVTRRRSTGERSSSARRRDCSVVEHGCSHVHGRRLGRGAVVS